MRPVPLSEPSHEARGFDGPGGLISAMGSPFLVTSSGWPVRFTWCSRARQVALNVEILTVFMANPTMVNAHGLLTADRAA